MNLNQKTAPFDLIAARRPEGYEMLYSEYAGRLYGLIKKELPNQQAADAVLEQTFLHICRNIHQFTGQLSFLTWAIQQARKAIREYREAKAQSGNTDLRETSYITASKRMPVAGDNSQQVFDLCLQGYKAYEIGEMLNLSPENVKLKIRKGIKKAGNR